MNVPVGLRTREAKGVATLHRLAGYNGFWSVTRAGRETAKTVKASERRWSTQLKLGVNEKLGGKGRGWAFAAVLLCLGLLSLRSEAEDTLYWNTNTSKVTAD